MDVVAWRIGLGKELLEYASAGLTLTVKLHCRICDTTTVVTGGHPLYPSEVKTGKPRHAYLQEPSWFGFAVKSRLGLDRHCPECGYVSRIPQRQQEALIAAADAALEVDWLQSAIETAGFRLIEFPVMINTSPTTGIYPAKKKFSCLGGNLRRWHVVEGVSNAACGLTAVPKNGFLCSRRSRICGHGHCRHYG